MARAAITARVSNETALSAIISTMARPLSFLDPYLVD